MRSGILLVLVVCCGCAGSPRKKGKFMLNREIAGEFQRLGIAVAAQVDGDTVEEVFRKIGTHMTGFDADPTALGEDDMMSVDSFRFIPAFEGEELEEFEIDPKKYFKIGDCGCYIHLIRKGDPDDNPRIYLLDHEEIGEEPSSQYRLREFLQSLKRSAN